MFDDLVAVVALDFEGGVVDCAAGAEGCAVVLEERGEVVGALGALGEAGDDGDELAAALLAADADLLIFGVEDFAGFAVARAGACAEGVVAALAGDGAFEGCAGEEVGHGEARNNQGMFNDDFAWLMAADFFDGAGARGDDEAWEGEEEEAEGDGASEGITKQELLEAAGISSKTFDTIRKAARIKGPSHGGLSWVFSIEDVVALVKKAESGRFTERGEPAAKAWRALLLERGVRIESDEGPKRRRW